LIPTQSTRLCWHCSRSGGMTKYRTWKKFDWDSMARLHQKGYITDP
jgi:hypothetical protein